MNHKIILNGLSASILAVTFILQTAQAEVPILETDIQSNSTYLMAQYTAATIKQDFSNRDSSVVENTDMNISGLDLVHSGSKVGSVIPLISMGATFYDIEDEEKYADFNIKAGLAIETGNKRHLFYADYNVRQEGYRDTIEIGAVLRATDVDNVKTGLELELSAALQEGTDTTSGGHSYTVSTNAKAMLNSKWFVTGQLLFGLQTDTEFNDGSYVESGPAVGAELGLAFQAHENLQFKGSIYSSFQNNEYYTSNSDYFLTDDQTLTGVGLVMTLDI
tara:strand:- start:251 stop:1078 length:828 start_codon:yes stop_codon:yes gene_type:complete